MRKAFKLVGASLFVLILAAGAILAQAAYRFDLRIDPIAGSIMREAAQKSWSLRVSLTPRPFAKGEPRSVILEKLAKSGFDGIPSDLKFIEPLIREGEVAFIRQGTNLACGYDLLVFLTFDDIGALTTADGAMIESGCL